jgi:Cys-tRNA(Pro)/Cys-tRNA(Cys) deacylase
VSATELVDPPDALAGFLHKHGVHAEFTFVPEGAHTAIAAAQFLGVPLFSIAKTMLATDGKTFIAAVLQGAARLDMRKLAEVTGTKDLKLASRTQVREQTGYPPGGVAPIAFLRQPTVVVDAALMQRADTTVVAGGGRENLLMRIPASEIVHFNQAVVADICESP